MKILILCTGNSCRSQMAEGLLESFDSELLDSKLEVHSAGTNPAANVSPEAVKVMKELGIDISGHWPKKADDFINDSFDYVITVCGHARETCPSFSGKVVSRLHMGFDDPADATGTQEEILNEFRRVRNQIKKQFYEFYQNINE